MPEILGEKLVDQVLGIVLGHANFFQDHALLARDVFRGEFRLEDHVGDDVEGFGEMLVQDARVEADHFLGSEGVEHAPERVDFPGYVFGGAAAGAFEDHVLDEMRDPVEVLRLPAGAGAKPYADGNGVDVRHGVGEDHQAVGQDCFFDVARRGCGH